MKFCKFTNKNWEKNLENETQCTSTCNDCHTQDIWRDWHIFHTVSSCSPTHWQILDWSHHMLHTPHTYQQPQYYLYYIATQNTF